MALLSDADAAAVRQQLDEALERPVRLLMFTQERECAYCRETRAICEEVAALSPRLSVQVLDFVADAETAARYRVDKIPAIVPLEVTADGGGERDFGIRFYGIPSGYEFAGLLEAIKLVGSGRLFLSRETLERVAELKAPVHLQVFVTPT